MKTARTIFTYQESLSEEVQSWQVSALVLDVTPRLDYHLDKDI